MLYKEYYHEHKSEEALAREEKHVGKIICFTIDVMYANGTLVDHCVEYIRGYAG